MKELHLMCEMTVCTNDSVIVLLITVVTYFFSIQCTDDVLRV